MFLFPSKNPYDGQNGMCVQWLSCPWDLVILESSLQVIRASSKYSNLLPIQFSPFPVLSTV